MTFTPIMAPRLIYAGEGAGYDVIEEGYKVDSTSSRMFVSKIKLFMCKDELMQIMKLLMIH